MTRIDPALEAWSAALSGSRELAMLVHDIKGALQGVIGGITRIDAAGVDPRLTAQVRRVAAAADALVALVTDGLGNLDTLADNEGEFGGTLELAAFADFLARRWSGEAEARGLVFRVDQAGDLPSGLAAGFLPLARIVGNLIGNAVKYSPAGEVHLTMRRGPAGGIVFAVTDEGPGIEPDDLPRVFDYGFRSRSGASPGQGLGLHIAKSLTERLGGTIALANRSQGGLEVSVSLPERVCAREGAGDGAETEALPDLSGMSVLLAEDNPTNQMVASQMLRALNAEVDLAADGLEALEAFERAPYDIVVIDIEMPRLSGLDVIRAIRGRADARARTPLVALTAYAMKEHRERIAEAGADGLISKPITSVQAFGRAVRDYARTGGGARSEAVQPAAAAGGATIDLETFETLRATIGPEMMDELLERVIADLEAAGSELVAAQAPLDLGLIRSSSHILISVAGAIGGVRLQQRARRLNMLAHNGEADAVGGELVVCLAEIRDVVGFVAAARRRE